MLGRCTMLSCITGNFKINNNIFLEAIDVEGLG
jgi:hypothetical protein